LAVVWILRTSGDSRPLPKVFGFQKLKRCTNRFLLIKTS